MARNWIVIGDPTTGGGNVVTASPFTNVDGKQVARVGDQATCKLHSPGVHLIVEGDPTLVVDGKPVALHGHAMACGCKVLSAQQVHVHVDAGGAGGGGGGSPSAAAKTAAAVAAKALINKLAAKESSREKPAYDEAIKFVSESGEPLAEVDYVLHLESGETREGRTDSEGLTERVETSSPEKILKAELIAATEPSCCASDGSTDTETVVIDLEKVVTTGERIGESSTEVKAKGHERPLTSGEIEMARLVFGDSVDYSKVKVHNHGYWLFLGLQSKDTAVTPNGEMYFPGDHFQEDFSALDVDKQQWFIHEMTHVWQYQLGYPLKSVRAFRPNMKYRYTLSDGKKFCDFNMEAQGDILADYFRFFADYRGVLAARLYP